MSNISLLVKEGLAFVANGQYQLALSRYDEAIEMVSNDQQVNQAKAYAIIWFNKGVAYDAMECRPEAIKCYRNSLDYDESDPGAWNNLGSDITDLIIEGRMSTDMLRLAFTAIERAIELRSEYSNAWYNKHRIYLIAGDTENAKKCLELSKSYE